MMDHVQGHTKGSSAAAAPVAEEPKRTILIYSPDLNFCFSLSMLFQDRYTVVTTTNPGLIELYADQFTADLVIVDAVPSESMAGRLAALRARARQLPVIMLYVYSTRNPALDTVIRRHVDAVIYKPFDIGDLARSVAELLPR